MANDIIERLESRLQAAEAVCEAVEIAIENSFGVEHPEDVVRALKSTCSTSSSHR